MKHKDNKYLKGSNGYTIYQKDRFGYKIPDTKEETVKATEKFLLEL